MTKILFFHVKLECQDLTFFLKHLPKHNLYASNLNCWCCQLGHLIGCVVGLPTSITGITLIALGTSLPDTFASRTAAQQDENADAAIGNVTGDMKMRINDLF